MDNQGLKVWPTLPIQPGHGSRTDARPRSEGDMTMKFRMFRLLTTVAMLAVLIEALGAGAKWG